MTQAEDDGWDQLELLRLSLSGVVVGSHWLQVFLVPFGIVGNSFYGLTRDTAWWSVVAFFLISGLVIARSLRRRRYQGDRFFADFMISRVRRIYPTLLVSTILAAGIGLVLRAADKSVYVGAAVNPARAAYVYLELWQDVLCSLLTFGFNEPGALSGNSNGPLWSLALEMQCYVIAALFAQALVTRRLWLRTTCLAGLGATFWWFAALAQSGLLGFPYFVAFYIGTVCSFMPLRLPRVTPRLACDFSYSLYALHFPIMLFFFFAFLQGAPTSAFVVAIAVTALLTSVGAAMACGSYVEHRWHRPQAQRSELRSGSVGSETLNVSTSRRPAEMFSCGCRRPHKLSAIIGGFARGLPTVSRGWAEPSPQAPEAACQRRRS